MVLNKTHLFALTVGLVAGLIVGFLGGKAMYDKPITEKVERDTVVVTDTVRYYIPSPVKVDSVRTEYKWMTRVKTDTVDHFVEVSKMVHDSVLVEVPITSKHYSAKEYDAWVSGYEPNLDSIFVYAKTRYITETITLSKPPNKWELDIVGGIDYDLENKDYTPYALGELMYKPNRLQVGIQGGVVKRDKVEPFIGGKVKIRIL